MRKDLKPLVRIIFSPFVLTLRLCAFAGIFLSASYAQNLAPNAPGKDAQWASAGKQAVGTSATLDSKIWFTLQGGMLTEVFYPQVDTANVNVLQFVVVNKSTGKIETERDDTIQTIDVLSVDANKKLPPFPSIPKSAPKKEFYKPKYRFSPYKKNQNQPNSPMFLQTNWAKDKKWRITKEYVVDPERNSILINVEFAFELKVGAESSDDFEVYVYYDPSMNNSGMHDTAWTQNGILLASDGDKVSALASKIGFGKITNGFLGTTDGLTQLRAKNDLKIYDKAENGNVVQFAQVNLVGGFVSSMEYFNDTFTLSFGKDAEEVINAAKLSLDKGFQKSQDEYYKGWADYVKTLPRVEPKYQAQFNMAAMVLKAFEDKTTRGGNVASLSVPWGGGNNGNETTTGYHLVWSRDLYQVATAFMALGDKAAAVRALEYLFKYQQRDDGSFPQISWLDGRTVGDSVQMDEISYPLILAYQLGKTDKTTFEKNIKKSADYIAKNGPFSKQERWEEESGYSPSTIAAEIAGLVCAAEIAKINGDTESAKRWLETADDWRANIEKWTATRSGKYGDGVYYLRLSQNGKPDSGEKLELGNGAGTFDEREIVDAGFLELVRLGIKSPDDALIRKSLKVVDEVLKVNTPNGEAWYRYNHDGYGDTYEGNRWNWDTTWRGNGHLWSLLTGERGQYELELANFKFQISNSKLKSENQKPRSKIQDPEFLRLAKTRLDAMLGFSNDGLMIPEQIWDKPEIPKTIDPGFMPPLKFGEGNGSATPLAWSMAQFIRLAVNLKAGRNLDTPDVVFNRYVKKK